MKKWLMYPMGLLVVVLVAIAVSDQYGRTPDHSFIAQQRVWLGGIALKVALVRITIVLTLLYLAAFKFVGQTASYLRTSVAAVVGTRYRLIFWYLAFELVFNLAYLR